MIHPSDICFDGYQHWIWQEPESPSTKFQNANFGHGDDMHVNYAFKHGLTIARKTKLNEDLGA